MKRLVFLFIGIFVLGFGVFAQNVGLTENLVVPPKYDASGISSMVENSFKAYFNKQMEDYELIDEGLVIMKFTVHPNGDVSNCTVEHSTSRYNTVAVRNILESSSGRWQPGSVNGQPVDMEKEITVKFVLRFLYIYKNQLRPQSPAPAASQPRKSFSIPSISMLFPYFLWLYCLPQSAQSVDRASNTTW